MIMLLAAISLVVATAAPAAPEYVKLNPGNMMTIKDDGKFAVHPAPDLSPADRDQLNRVKAAGEEAMGSKSITTRLPAQKAGIIADELSFHLLNVGTDTVLFIRNGLKDSVRYKLVIKTANGVGPTDVCEVVSDRHGTEHWPYRIQWVAIGAVERFKRSGDGPPECR